MDIYSSWMEEEAMNVTPQTGEYLFEFIEKFRKLLVSECLQVRFVVVFSKQFYSAFLFSVEIIKTAVSPFLLG